MYTHIEQNQLTKNNIDINIMIWFNLLKSVKILHFKFSSTRPAKENTTDKNNTFWSLAEPKCLLQAIFHRQLPYSHCNLLNICLCWPSQCWDLNRDLRESQTCTISLKTLDYIECTYKNEIIKYIHRYTFWWKIV